MTDNKMERYKVKKAIKDLVKNINETTHIPIVTEDDIFELFQLDSIADLRKVSRNFLKLSKILDYFFTVTEIATSEKEGIVKFGIENGNAVDVKDWIKGIGGVIGGYVSKVSNKEAGKWYLNDLTDGKIYKCIQNHTSTSFDTTKYLDISNYGLSDKLENLFKVEILSMTHLLGYIAASDVTEWYVTLPAHIKKDKVISVTNINQGFLVEYCNLDLASNCVRMGGKGNFSSTPPSALQVLIAYFT